MRSPRMLLGGLLAALSLGIATTATAEPAIQVQYEPWQGYDTSQQPKSGCREDHRTSRVNLDEEIEAKVLALVNEARTTYGLNELREDPRAWRSARRAAHEAYEARGFRNLGLSLSERLSDQGLDLSRRSYGEARASIKLSDVSYRAYNEEYGFVQEYDIDLLARRIVGSWLKNPSFSSVILSEELSHAGIVAVVKGDKVFVVLDAFGPSRYWMPDSQRYDQRSYPQPYRKADPRSDHSAY